MLSFLGSKAERAETAMELFKNAATNYKLAKSCNNKFELKLILTRGISFESFLGMRILR